jgi:hypothetical protein
MKALKIITIITLIPIWGFFVALFWDYTIIYTLLCIIGVFLGGSTRWNFDDKHQPNPFINTER